MLFEELIKYHWIKHNTGYVYINPVHYVQYWELYGVCLYQSCSLCSTLGTIWDMFTVILFIMFNTGNYMGYVYAIPVHYVQHWDQYGICLHQSCSLCLTLRTIQDTFTSTLFVMFNTWNYRYNIWYIWQMLHAIISRFLIQYNACLSWSDPSVESHRKSSIHYGGVIMSATASQITSFKIVYSTVYSGTDQRKHQSSASLAFVWGIHR